MKNSIKILGLATLAVAAFGTTAMAQTTDVSHVVDARTANTSVGAYGRVINPITIASIEEMNFGAWYNSGLSTTQTVTLGPNNTTTDAVTPTFSSGLLPVTGANAGANLDADGDGTEQGRVRVSGEEGFVYQVANTGVTGLPTGITVTGVTLARVGGSGSAAAPIVATLPSGAIGSVQTTDWHVGATLNIAPAAVAGSISAHVIMQAQYQ